MDNGVVRTKRHLKSRQTREGSKKAGGDTRGGWSPLFGGYFGVYFGGIWLLLPFPGYFLLLPPPIWEYSSSYFSSYFGVFLLLFSSYLGPISGRAPPPISGHSSPYFGGLLLLFRGAPPPISGRSSSYSSSYLGPNWGYSSSYLGVSLLLVLAAIPPPIWVLFFAYLGFILLPPRWH